ncbi:hypothetical protein CYY_001385 [Polysphondylium violaceum]|uniref:DNA damage-binding protein 1 n=1 Tax=Polysphondylium violaceum TaxID=133409 RepID=A0A8J4Q3D0_9MYCE|nr:hypothetical protein CYY_001385 [Polysphondylium violaceum]
MYNFVSTVQKPTAVTHSVTGYFTSPNEKNLIISKCTKIEIFLMKQEGLQPMLDVNIYGRIATLKLFSIPGEKQEYLFISTESYKFCVLSYDSEKKEIVTRASGNAEDTIGRPTDSGQIGVIDPNGRIIALHLYEGLLKLIPIEKGQASPIQKDAFNIRLEELQVLDICFLYLTSKPTIAVLYKDTRGAKHVSTYEILLRDKELAPGPWMQSNVDIFSSMLIPVPLGGVLVVGDHAITYVNGPYPKSITIPFTRITAVERVDKDGSRFLFGDNQGKVSVLLLQHDGKIVSDLKWEMLGRTSIPSCISYLDSGVVYVGSTSGDSQLIKLNTEKDPQSNSYISILENYTNLGPIVDFCVVDLEKQGQGQIVTCSGVYRDGTLRVIRNGIGIADQASIPLEGIKGLWSLKPASSKGTNAYDKYLVTSFIGYTKILSFEGEEIEDTEIQGFDLESQTIDCATLFSHSIYIQITQKSINLIDINTSKRIDSWSPPAASSIINLCSRNNHQIIISIGKELYYFEISHDRKLCLMKEISLPHEISCLDISSFGDERVSTLCAVGLWTDISIRLLLLPSLEQVSIESLGGEIIPRSILMVSFEGIRYLFCSLGDGHLFNFVVDRPANGTYQLNDRKRLTLGTQPITLCKFKLKNTINVFASSDRPTIIYSSNKKLFYSVVNLKEVSHVCSFDSEAFPNCMAIASDNSLTIGSIDDIQKLHIKTISLNGEMARRISHLDEYSCFAVITLRKEQDNSPLREEKDECFLKLFNDQTFEITSTYAFQPFEIGWSVIPCKFTDDNTTYLAVATTFSYPDGRRPNGRILLFSINQRRLVLLDEISTKASVYTLHNFNGKLLAAVNKRLISIKYTLNSDSTKTMKSDCVYKGHTLILQLASRGDFILVGDMMKSMSLLVEKPDGSVEQIARNPQPLWLRALSMISDDYFIGAEAAYNFVVVKKNSESTNELERELLDSVGHYHIGESVNFMKYCSLSSQPDTDTPPIPTVVYCTLNGSLGVIASITREEYEFFSKLQKGLNNVVRGIGGFSHDHWRAFHNDHHTIQSRNFIDGDLIETFMDLKREEMLLVVKDMNISVEECYKKIETLIQHIR